MIQEGFTMMRILARILLCAVSTVAVAQSITLYPPRDPVTQKYDEGKSCFSFKYGRLKEDTKGSCELFYDGLSIGGEGSFLLPGFKGTRNVMKDLGAHQWEDSFEVPVLEPLPKLAEGEYRTVVVDASGGPHAKIDAGKNTIDVARISAPAVPGHIYLVHVKDEAADFYTMFRVEKIDEQNHCTIVWRLVPTPKGAPSTQP
jgi:hypothetical protein